MTGSAQTSGNLAVGVPELALTLHEGNGGIGNGFRSSGGHLEIPYSEGRQRLERPRRLQREELHEGRFFCCDPREPR